jgi:hypothetical protein
MARVLFITQDSAYPQMGVLYLADALRKKGIESEIVASGLSSEDLDDVVEMFKPDVVGMSVLTAPQVIDFENHSIFLKENHPNVKVVWGGNHPTLLTDLCLASPYIDHVFVGKAGPGFPGESRAMDRPDSTISSRRGTRMTSRDICFPKDIPCGRRIRA